MTNKLKLSRSIAAGLGAWIGLAGAASADQVFTDDVIVQGSLCAGVDCTNGYNFGFDTIVMRENNLRLFFNDTSVSASFPSTDWRIVANDSSNGGANYLAFEDATVGRIPFLVEGGAPANTLYVEADGDVGIKTANPVVDLHIVEGNTPTLRLEQDGSDGFTPQIWDVAGNEANFFIRDVTNGSKLSFKIKPGAPENTVFLAASGNVGLNTASPSESLHIRQTDGTAALYIQDVSTAATGLINMIKLDNYGDVGIRMQNTATTDKWALVTAGGGFTINGNGGNPEFSLSAAGNLTLLGTITTSGSCSTGCDAVFEQDYHIPAIADRAAMMYDLGYLPNVGPTAESGQYDLTTKVLGMLNELEHAHIYIAQLNDRIAVLEERLQTSD